MNKATPKVSVLMSVYNGSRYLRESIDSILNQTFTNFEFIIINDCSTDNSWEILTEYADKDQRIVLIKNQENLGLTKSLNKGLQVVKGEYIARQDADDVSHINRLQIQAEFLDKHPEVGAIGANAKAIDEQGQFLGQQYVLSEYQNLIEHEKLQAFLLINNCLLHSTLVARQSLIQKLNGYNEKLRYAQDYDLWWHLSQVARLASLPEQLILVRRSTQNITSQKRQEQLICSLRISLGAVTQSLNEQPLDEKSYQRFWWATLQLFDRESYQRFWLNQHGQDALLRSKDIDRLQPFWNLLATFPGASQVWGLRLHQLAHDLLRYQQTVVGLQLLWISVYRLRMSIEWGKTTKALVKPYVPGVGQKFWNSRKLKHMES